MKKITFIIIFLSMTKLLFAQFSKTPNRTTQWAPYITSNVPFVLGEFYQDYPGPPRLLVALERRANGYQRSVKYEHYTTANFVLSSNRDADFLNFINSRVSNNVTPAAVTTFATYLMNKANTRLPTGYILHAIECQKLDLEEVNSSLYRFEFRAIYIK